MSPDPYVPFNAIVCLPAGAWPQGGNPGVAVQFFGALRQGHDRIMRDRPHWYLELLAVRPEYQGKGLSSKLLRWALEQADKEGTAAFLESVPEAQPVYEKYGFSCVEELKIDTPLVRVNVPLMLRESQAS